MTVIGTQKQEEKISEMGKIACDMSPEIDLLNVKGAFRLGIKKALSALGYSEWKDLADKTNREKKEFFKLMLEKTQPYLSNLGFSDRTIVTLFEKLKEMNGQYLERSSRHTS